MLLLRVLRTPPLSPPPLPPGGFGDIIRKDSSDGTELGNQALLTASDSPVISTCSQESELLLLSPVSVFSDSA